MLRVCVCVCVGETWPRQQQVVHKEISGGGMALKKERCVYSMISTDQMHIPYESQIVNDSRVWPTLRRQRHGVEWFCVA